MKTKSHLLLLCVLLASCSNPLGDALDNEAKSRVGEAASSYKSSGYEITDTVRVKDRIAELKGNIALLDIVDDLNYDKFVEMRNQEFKEFRSDTTYEEAVMNGRLKDASPWCTEIRVVTETADSIIASWNNDTPHTWDAMRTYMFYLTRRSQYYDSDRYDEDWRKSIMEEVDGLKPLFDELQALKSAPADSLLYFNVLHKYSVVNPLFDKRFEFTDSVAVDFNNNVLGSEHKTDVGDLLKQLAK